MQEDWVLITGASGGIGRELARVLAERGGHPLVLSAKSEAPLVQLAEEITKAHGIRTRVLPKDLAQPGAAAEIEAWLQGEKVTVSMLVNSAGFALNGPFAQRDFQAYRDMIQVNLTSLAELTHRLVKPMVARGRGRILNVCSTAAFQPGPLMAVYYATKSFLFSFSYALANELAGTGVTVTTLCPGPTRTEFCALAGATGSERIYGKWMMEPRAVAEIGYRALMRGKRIVIPGFVNKLGYLWARAVPTRWSAALAKIVTGGASPTPPADSSKAEVP